MHSAMGNGALKQEVKKETAGYGSNNAGDAGNVKVFTFFSREGAPSHYSTEIHARKKEGLLFHLLTYNCL